MDWFIDLLIDWLFYGRMGHWGTGSRRVDERGYGETRWTGEWMGGWCIHVVGMIALRRCTWFKTLVPRDRSMTQSAELKTRLDASMHACIQTHEIVHLRIHTCMQKMHTRVHGYNYVHGSRGSKLYEIIPIGWCIRRIPGRALSNSLVDNANASWSN